MSDPHTVTRSCNPDSTRRAFLGRMAAFGACIPLAFSRTGSFAAGLSDQTVCVFSKHLQHLDFNEMADAVARMGFDGIDLTVRPGGHIEPADAEEQIPKAVKAAEAAGVRIPMMTTAITSADDPLTEPILRTAASHGIQAYRLGYLSFDENLPIEQTLDAHRIRLEKLAAVNRQLGLHGGYQNHAGTRIGGPLWDLWYIIKDLDPRWIGCQYDIRHAFVEGARAWPLGLRLMRDRIRTCCIKDFRWEEREDGWHVVNVPIGEGMVPFDRYLDLCGEYGIDAAVSMHFEYRMTPEGVDHHSMDGRRAVERAMTADLAAYRERLVAADARR